VKIGKPFAVGRLHVTVNQFAVFVNETGYDASSKCSVLDGHDWEHKGSWRDPGFSQEGSHPVVCVSWNDANAYVNWLAKKSGKSYRLLSEAEWEYAARGRMSPGAYPRFWFGNDEKAICRYGKGPRPSIGRRVQCNAEYNYTSPAGHYEPNAFGLYDMTGNAWQWTADCYHDSYWMAPTDGSAWTTGCPEDDHVARGGSWFSDPWDFRAARRRKYSGETSDIGFRVTRALLAP
jgi:formylglycine-generating enzyme required for sulfatase activity